MGVSINGDTQNGWFIMEKAIKIDDDWDPYDSGNPHIYVEISSFFWSSNRDIHD